MTRSSGGLHESILSGVFKSLFDQLLHQRLVWNLFSLRQGLKADKGADGHSNTNELRGFPL